jgi:hypothetical protein
VLMLLVDGMLVPVKHGEGQRLHPRGARLG